MAQIEFARILASLRKQAGLSQQELAKRLGISNRAVSKWENGLALPAIEHFLTLSEIFGVSIEQLLTLPKAETPETPPAGMESLRELYKTGRGPSSSHTMGPEKACRIFKERNAQADRFEVKLFGSLAKTGKGHGTDTVIQKTLSPLPCTILWDTVTTDLPHPNTLELTAFAGDTPIDFARAFSVGGGRVAFENYPVIEPPLVYKLTTFRDIAAYCTERQIALWQYVEETEGPEIWNYLAEIWEAMKASIKRGLADEGVLPGGLDVQKKAKHLSRLQHVDETGETRQNRMVSSYAFAVSEQNACGEEIVTAPTCGAAGVLPAVLYYEQKKHRYGDGDILRALATGGLIGNLIKTNASISGAECGCQAEIGTACAMAAAALAELFELSLDKIEYAAEVAIEHHLGLTCDPICGLVQIPCIERNAVAAMRAINAVNLSSFLSDSRKISLDKVLITMKETGRDLAHQYRETSEGGLAKIQFHV